MKKILILWITTILLFALSACGTRTIDCDEGFKLEGTRCVEVEGEIVEPVIIIEPPEEVVSEEGTLQFLTMDYDGLEREYILYLPFGLAEDAPLVFMLHGITGNASNFMTYSGMNDIADIYKFAVVYPQGSEVNNITHWNADLSFTTVDDVGFLVAMAEFLQAEYYLSAENTFVAGHSNGGFMSYTLACDAPDTFKAIASYAGLMSGETWETRDEAVPISILQIHGTNDLVVPNDGSMTNIGGWGGAPEDLTMLDFWAILNGSGDLVMDDTSDKVTVYSWKNEITKDMVVYYEIQGQSHSWADDDIIFTDDDILNDTSQLIWSFFASVIGSEE